MTLEMHAAVTIRHPESTPTGNESRHPKPGGTRHDDVPHRYPPDHLRLPVAMTFKDDTPRLTLVGTDIAAGGERIEEAFRRLIEDTRAWLALSEDPRADLLGYSPTTWFRFVAPEDLYPKERPKTLAERLEEAYRDDELEPQEREFLDLTREHFSRLDDE